MFFGVSFRGSNPQATPGPELGLLPAHSEAEDVAEATEEAVQEGIDVVTEDLPDSMEDAVNEVGVALRKMGAPDNFLVHHSLKNTPRLLPEAYEPPSKSTHGPRTGFPVRWHCRSWWTPWSTP